jgi:hypothetical protein
MIRTIAMFFNCGGLLLLMSYSVYFSVFGQEPWHRSDFTGLLFPAVQFLINLCARLLVKASSPVARGFRFFVKIIDGFLVVFWLFGFLYALLAPEIFREDRRFVLVFSSIMLLSSVISILAMRRKTEANLPGT